MSEHELRITSYIYNNDNKLNQISKKKVNKNYTISRSSKIQVPFTRYNSHHTNYNLDNHPEDLFNTFTDITHTHLQDQSFIFKIIPL